MRRRCNVSPVHLGWHYCQLDPINSFGAHFLGKVIHDISLRCSPTKQEKPGNERPEKSQAKCHYLNLALQAQTRELRWRCLGFFERYLGVLFRMPPRPNPVCLCSNARWALSLASIVTRYMLYTEFAGGNGAGGRSICEWLPSTRPCWQGWNMIHSKPSYECSMCVRLLIV